MFFLIDYFLKYKKWGLYASHMFTQLLTVYTSHIVIYMFHHSYFLEFWVVVIKPGSRDTSKQTSYWNQQTNLHLKNISSQCFLRLLHYYLPTHRIQWVWLDMSNYHYTNIWHDLSHVCHMQCMWISHFFFHPCSMFTTLSHDHK